MKSFVIREEVVIKEAGPENLVSGTLTLPDDSIVINIVDTPIYIEGDIVVSGYIVRYLLPLPGAKGS